MSALDELPTPGALVDRDVLRRNLERMAARLARLGVALRPHVKTHKCVEIGEMQRHLGAAGVTVSTLREAAAFADAGFTDLTWAFPVILNRLREVREIGEAAAKQAGAGGPSQDDSRFALWSGQADRARRGRGEPARESPLPLS